MKVYGEQSLMCALYSVYLKQAPVLQSHLCVCKKWNIITCSVCHLCPQSQFIICGEHPDWLDALCPLAAGDTVEAKSVSFGWRRWRSSALWRPRKSPVGVVRTQLSRIYRLRPLPGSVSQYYSALWWTEQQKDARKQLREQCLVYASQVILLCVSTF